MSKKKIIVSAIAVIVIAGIAAAGLFLSKKHGNDIPADNKQITDVQKDDNNLTESAQPKQEEEQTGEKQENKQNSSETEKTPVFMYFVSESDSNYDEALKVFEELKKEYGTKIEFDLKNVTKDPKLLENFSLVDGNTPALIMDGKEGIVGFQFKMTDKNTLKSEIEKALK